MDRTLYFLHIPKTAGTSLRRWLTSHFRGEEEAPELVFAKLLELPRERLTEYRLICGHHGMYLPSLLLRPPMIVTVLRDPVSRSISHFGTSIRARSTPCSKWSATSRTRSSCIPTMARRSS